MRTPLIISSRRIRRDVFHVRARCGTTAARHRLRSRGEVPLGSAHRGGDRPCGEAPAGEEHVRGRRHRRSLPRQRDQGQGALSEGQGIRRKRRRGDHRRRVHRAPHARPALERRPPPGRRGEGKPQDPARDPDLRDDHHPELLPHVQEARGHDRYRVDRGRGALQGLQARGHADPDQQTDGPEGQPRPGLQDRAGEVGRGRGRGEGAQRCGQRC